MLITRKFGLPEENSTLRGERVFLQNVTRVVVIELMSEFLMRQLELVYNYIIEKDVLVT